MAERIGVLGYAGVGVETTAGTAVTPSDWIPFVNLNLNTELNLDEDTAAFGVYHDVYQVNQGQRSHTGSAEFMAEPNTAARLLDMVLTHGSVTGANPYTHPFTASGTTKPHSYTIDKSSGNIVERYYGCQISKVTPKFDKSQMRFSVDISALGSFRGRQIATVATTTLTLDTTYDPKPNTGLVVGDLVRIYKATTGATLDTTIATVNVDGITVTLAASAAAFATGDMINLRPATISLNTLVNTPFLWPKSQYCFGATASAALSATQTRLESGSTWDISHPFNDSKGEGRSGGFDPAALVRLPPKPTFKIKKFFDTPEDLQAWMQINKTACVIRHFAGATNQYELRVTLNNLRWKTLTTNIDAKKIIYAEIEGTPTWDTSDTQAFDVKAINAYATI